MPVSIDSAKSFEEGTKGNSLSVIHFSADFVEQCKQVDDILDALSKQQDYVNVKFFTCDAEKLSEISLKFNIDAAPTILYFKSGSAIDRVNGADTAKITAKVKEHNALVSNAKDSQIPLEERLKALINRHNVMLFMKGDRNTPRCGFSRQIVDILNGLSVSYDTFDILSDEEVRQGLKKYSDWPTYPQLYVKGELIGGLDIVKEMQAAGELLPTLSS